jgi:OFA family oxalate/formate antiporter-like MFS transporter
LTNATGSWHAVFYVAAILNIAAAVMALFVLKPMRIRTMTYSAAAAMASAARDSPASVPAK